MGANSYGIRLIPKEEGRYHCWFHWLIKQKNPIEEREERPSKNVQRDAGFYKQYELHRTVKW